MNCIVAVVLVSPLSPANGSILWGVILCYLVIKGMFLKIRRGRAKHIRGSEICLTHPGSRELLFKHPILTGHVLMLAPILYICAYICMSHVYMCARTHTHTYTYTHTHTHIANLSELLCLIPHTSGKLRSHCMSP